jgi:hypothetical protein
MKYLLVSLLLSASFYLCSCSVISKDKAEIEKVAEDLAVEIVEDAALL